MVLLGQDDADEADDGVAPMSGSTADFVVEPPRRAAAPDVPPDGLREGGEGQDAGLGGLQVADDGGWLAP